ncbi:hypothetical protein C6Y62_15040 [Hyphomicrobium sulfonivorans]|nr:hypothetical protein [Hyphomicrobium sulfonivorans]
MLAASFTAIRKSLKVEVITPARIYLHKLGSAERWARRCLLGSLLVQDLGASAQGRFHGVSLRGRSLTGQLAPTVGGAFDTHLTLGHLRYFIGAA